jgi:hypothetical protein
VFSMTPTGLAFRGQHTKCTLMPVKNTGVVSSMIELGNQIIHFRTSSKRLPCTYLASPGPYTGRVMTLRNSSKCHHDPHFLNIAQEFAGLSSQCILRAGRFTSIVSIQSASHPTNQALSIVRKPRIGIDWFWAAKFHCGNRARGGIGCRTGKFGHGTFLRALPGRNSIARAKPGDAHGRAFHQLRCYIRCPNLMREQWPP